MPSIPKFGPPKLGRFVLSRQQKVENWRWLDDARCKDSRRLHFVVSDPLRGEDGVHIIGRDKLPDDVTIWFSLAGEDGLFENDLNQFCHTLVFCSYLRVEGEDGEHRWIKGFNIGEILRKGPVAFSDQFLEKEVKALLGDNLFQHARRTMFVNLYGPPPQNMPAAASSLFLHMISVLGHMKFNALLLERGVSVRSLSHVARTFYASAYERRAALGLQTSNYTQDFKRWMGQLSVAMIRSINDKWLPDVHSKMVNAYTTMPLRERRYFSLDPNESPQDVGPYDRLVVELR